MGWSYHHDFAQTKPSTGLSGPVDKSNGKAVTVKPRYRFSTVDRGLRETVSYRNALGFFSDLGIEMVRAPPLRATETTVT